MDIPPQQGRLFAHMPFTASEYAALEEAQRTGEQAAKDTNIIADIVGIPPTVSSLFLIVDGTNRVQEAPTTTHAFIGMAEVVGGLAALGFGVIVERIRHRRVKTLPGLHVLEALEKILENDRNSVDGECWETKP